jgi:hypothetical protein
MRYVHSLKMILVFAFATALGAQELPTSEAAAHVGQSATVCGMVMGIHYAGRSRGNPTFIDFGRPYPSQDFTVVIWSEDRASFGDLGQHVGRELCAHGVVSLYRGRPEMALHSADSLRTR